jgi:hypothetical protein
VNAVAAGTVVPTASVIAASARYATAPVYTTPNPLHSHPEAAMLMVITPSRASTPRTPRSRKQGGRKVPSTSCCITVSPGVASQYSWP